MSIALPDSLPPPPDLDVPAARGAVRYYRAAIARGVAEDAAWREACNLFALYHHAWPLPLAEREAARTVGAMLARERGGGTPGRVCIPARLAARLASPALPGPDASPAPFRATLPLAGRPWPFPVRLPVMRWPAPLPPPSTPAGASC